MALTDDLFKKLLFKMLSDTHGRTLPSRGSHAAQDIAKGRRTELEYLNGLVVRKGQEANVPTPLNEAVTSIARQIDRGALKADLSNLRLLEKLS